ncbi:helix-turn-helix domain-containing protein [Actinomadura sp. WMMA1423]|uniref:helix-turn-helix domain-containing protein n=1 Tax=Actinomadura sp. WMMA1423 TaxID=2591108 RepID=UPI00197AFAED|nr:helix-turn-helix domain-containing protein [Actinomadura sp. WMMA1423]
MRAAQIAVQTTGRSDESTLATLELLDADEVAALLKSKASTVKEKARRREIPFVMFGGSYRWTIEHVRAIIQQYEVTPGAEKRPAEPRRRRKVKTPAGESGAPAVTPLRARPPQRLRRAAGDGRD